MYPKPRKCNGFDSLSFEITAANVSTDAASPKEVKLSVDNKIEALKLSRQVMNELTEVNEITGLFSTVFVDISLAFLLNPFCHVRNPSMNPIVHGLHSIYGNVLQYGTVNDLITHS